MRPTNGPVALVLAAMVAVAVVGGGVAAGRNGPRAQSGLEAAPLTGSAPGSTTPPVPPATKAGLTLPVAPSKPAPSTTGPSRTAAATVRTAAVELPIRVELKLSDLPTGRPPQLAYRAGRVISGGAGEQLTVPGTQRILQAARFGPGALLILATATGSELVRLPLYSDKFEPERMAGVQSLVISPDADRAAYATQGRVYWEAKNEVRPRRVLRAPRMVSQLLAVRGDLVYFELVGPGAEPDTVTVWNSATGKVATVSAVHGLQSLNNAGTAAGDQLGGSGQVTCSALVDLATGTRRWRTCEYVLNTFTPDDRTVVATQNGPEPATAVLDAATGDVRREWIGPEILGAAPEDDEHVLMVASDYDVSTRVETGAIIRCAVRTRTCQLATPVSRHERFELELL